MMDLTVRACVIKEINIEGAENGYITSIDGLTALNQGSESGWIGNLKTATNMLNFLTTNRIKDMVG